MLSLSQIGAQFLKQRAGSVTGHLPGWRRHLAQHLDVGEGCLTAGFALFGAVCLAASMDLLSLACSLLRSLSALRARPRAESPCWPALSLWQRIRVFCSQVVGELVRKAHAFHSCPLVSAETSPARRAARSRGGSQC